MLAAIKSAVKLGRLWAFVQFDYGFSPSAATREHITPELQRIVGDYSLDELSVWVLILYSQTVDPRDTRARPQFEKFKGLLMKHILDGKVQNRALIQRFSQELKKYGIAGEDLLEDPFDFEVPFSPSLPDVTKTKPVRVFTGGHLVAMYMKNVKPVAAGSHGGPSIFEYPNVMVVVNSKTKKPILFITYELSKLTGSAALCSFLPDGSRENYGRDDHAISPDGFVDRALAMTSSALGVKFVEIRG